MMWGSVRPLAVADALAVGAELIGREHRPRLQEFLSLASLVVHRWLHALLPLATTDVVTASLASSGEEHRRVLSHWAWHTPLGGRDSLLRTACCIPSLCHGWRVSSYAVNSFKIPSVLTCTMRGKAAR